MRTVARWAGASSTVSVSATKLGKPAWFRQESVSLQCEMPSGRARRTEGDVSPHPDRFTGSPVNATPTGEDSGK